MAWTVEYYEEISGRQPGEVFEDAIPGRLRSKLVRFTEEVARQEGEIGGGIWKSCRDYPGIFEVRVIHQKMLGRYYAAVDDGRLVILHGYQKMSGDDTPTAVLDRAQAFLEDYRRTKRVSPTEPEE